MGAPLPTGQVSLRPASPCPCSTASPDPPDRGGAAGFARWGGIQPRLRIIRAVFAALTDPAGFTAHRPGPPERAHSATLPGGIPATGRRDQDPMCAVLEELGLAELITTIAELDHDRSRGVMAARFTRSDHCWDTNPLES